METFLVETLKSVKLSKTIQDQRDRLVEKITRLLEEIPGSGASSQVDVSNGSLKISGGKGHICSFFAKMANSLDCPCIFVKYKLYCAILH